MATPKRTSQQKRRHLAKRPLEKTLLEEVQEAVSRWSVLSAEEEYEGEWDSLGFRIDVSEETTAEDVLEMGNALLALLKDSPAAAKLTGTWIIGIYRSDELVRVVTPRDKPQFICAVCGYEQEKWSDVCIQCKTPW